MTAKTDTLASAMALAFAEIEGAYKTVTGQVGQQKYKYADLGAVIDAIKPALTKHGLFFTQVNHVVQDGVCVETIIHHTGGDKLSCGQLYVPANKRDAQGFGSALTYARRYGLMTAFGVPAEDDDGNAAAQSYTARQPANGNGHQARMAEERDAPFPQGPCKNKTELKTTVRSGLWREVEGAGDEDELAGVLEAHKDLIAQLKAALPTWWSGGQKDGEPFEGLGQIVERKQRDFANLADFSPPASRNPVLAG